jgi:tetratricopeptide (TPR) repeat protein
MLVAVSPRDVDVGLDELLRQSLLRERRGSERSYSFAHALVQEAVYAGLLVRRRKELHARVATAIELLERERAEEHYGVLAYHYAQAEDWSKAQEYLFKLGDQALRIAADAEAIDHFERALDAYGRAFGNRWDPFERAAVERKIGEARYRLGDFDKATTHLDRALDLLHSARPRTRVTVRVAILRELFRQLGHRILPATSGRTQAAPRLSEAILQTLWFHQFIDYSNDLERLLYDILRTLNIAESAGPSHRTLRAYFGMTLMCHNVGLSGMGRRYAHMTEAMAVTIGDGLARAIANASIGLDLYAAGRWDDAESALAESAGGYWTAGELEAWAAICGYLNIVRVGKGRLAQALPIADDLERAGREARDRRIEALGPHCRAHVLSWAGREDAAVAEYERAMTQYRGIPDNHLWLGAAGELAKTHLRVDGADAARGLVAEGTALARAHRLSGWWLTPLLTAQAELLVRDAQLGGPKRREHLAAAERVCRQLDRQGKLHFEAVPPALRQRGSLEWQRGHKDRAQDAWRRSLDAAARLGAVTETFATYEAMARYTSSSQDRAAAESIAAKLRAALPAAAS